ncbi:MAG: hypothetical protein QM639_04485 [Rhodocyclaceae bacterium]
MSLAAIALSVVTLYLNGRSSSRARRRSVLDEFWLRKVFYEETLSPIIAFYREVASDVGSLASGGHVLSPADYLEAFSKKHRELAMRLVLIGTLSSELQQSLEACFESLENEVAELCYELRGNAGGIRSHPSGRIYTLLAAFVHPVRAFQEGVK